MSTSTLERGVDDQRQRAPIDPRIAARRRQVARDVGKRRRTRLIAFVLVLASIAAVVGLIRSPLLDLDRFQVTESRHVTSDEIINASGVRPGDALALIDAGEVRSALLALPWVADASVSVAWPNALRLAVTERVPVATVAVPPASPAPAGSGTTWMLVDAEGRVLGPATAAPSDDANGPVLIEGITVPAPGGTLDPAGQDALDVVAGLSPGLRTRVDAVVVGAEGEVTLRLRPDMVALVGPITDLDQKLMALQTTLAQVDLTDLESIDLRVPGRVDVRRRQPPPSSTGSSGGSTSGSSTSSSTGSSSSSGSGSSGSGSSSGSGRSGPTSGAANGTGTSGAGTSGPGRTSGAG